VLLSLPAIWGFLILVVVVALPAIRSKMPMSAFNAGMMLKLPKFENALKLLLLEVV